MILLQFDTKNSLGVYSNKGVSMYYDEEEYFEAVSVYEKYESEGCKFNRPTKHNGKYVKIMDWAIGKPIGFVELSSGYAKLNPGTGSSWISGKRT